jgi:hypothetical protein
LGYKKINNKKNCSIKIFIFGRPKRGQRNQKFMFGRPKRGQKDQKVVVGRSAKRPQKSEIIEEK